MLPCEAELKTEAAAGDQKRNDLLLKGTHKKEEDESEQNERKTNKKHVRNEKNKHNEANQTWQFKEVLW